MFFVVLVSPTPYDGSLPSLHSVLHCNLMHYCVFVEWMVPLSYSVKTIVAVAAAAAASLPMPLIYFLPFVPFVDLYTLMLLVVVVSMMKLMKNSYDCFLLALLLMLVEMIFAASFPMPFVDSGPFVSSARLSIQQIFVNHADIEVAGAVYLIESFAFCLLAWHHCCCVHYLYR